ncbi:MAG: sugar phosphate isomerase/epimerase [Kiritimatiellae bacterium]|nr:sugar phosphate isomerase/epimerase [Kiritimatiellia bacterium]
MPMYMTGFADEAARDIDGQIRATKTLGWTRIESRNIDGQNIHDLPEADFEAVCDKLEAADIRINCFGSAIANWAKDVRKPFDADLEQTKRAIPRMQRLGTKLIRIMSYPPLHDRPLNDQMEDVRVARLRELTRRFLDAGIQPVHENCMNYGGLGAHFTLRLLEAVPGLKLVFDTGNPVFTFDRTQPVPYPYQSAWDFYRQVREHVVYVHIKDGHMADGKAVFTFCGEGVAEVPRICADLVKRGYDGGISIEPHLAAVAHDQSVKSSEEIMFANYVEYGRRMEKMLVKAGAVLAK